MTTIPIKPFTCLLSIGSFTWSGNDVMSRLCSGAVNIALLQFPIWDVRTSCSQTDKVGATHVSKIEMVI